MAFQRRRHVIAKGREHSGTVEFGGRVMSHRNDMKVHMLESLTLDKLHDILLLRLQDAVKAGGYMV